MTANALLLPEVLPGWAITSDNILVVSYRLNVPRIRARSECFTAFFNVI